jgi:hypothetical protein
MDESFKPIADSAKNITDMAKGAFQFLKLISFPAAEEFGHLLEDEIRFWRIKNIAKMVNESKNILESNGSIDDLTAPPRLAYKIMEEGSLIDDEKVQEMWAGLLASSCTVGGKDESNLIYVDLLSKLTSSEVALLNHLCDYTKKGVSHNGLIYVKFITLGLDILQTLFGFKDIHKINHEISHLKSLGLVQSVDSSNSSVFYAMLKPTSLCLNMYVKCKGSSVSPVEYWSGYLHDDVRPENSDKYLEFI